MTFDVQKVSSQIHCAESNESDPQLLRLCRLKLFEKVNSVMSSCCT